MCGKAKLSVQMKLAIARLGHSTHSTRGNNGEEQRGGEEWGIRKQGRGSTRVGEPGPGGAGESCLAGA